MREFRSSALPKRDDSFHLERASSRVVLRLRSWDARADATPLTLAGCALPDRVGAVVERSPRILCTGPGDWLIVHPPTEVGRLRDAWAPPLTAQSLTFVDLTAGLITLALSGTSLREVFEQSCGLDFDPRHFGAGQCARTRFAQIPVVIDCIQDLSRVELYVARSHAHYLQDWLLDVAQFVAPATRT
jgi:heterotetrameric sarcosine oxidase gamma subunit